MSSTMLSFIISNRDKCPPELLSLYDQATEAYVLVKKYNDSYMRIRTSSDRMSRWLFMPAQFLSILDRCVELSVEP